MKYKQLGRTGLYVSELCLGTMTLGGNADAGMWKAIGAVEQDSSGYPDCRPEYIAAFERLAALATAAGVQGGAFRIHAPLQMLTKADIVRAGQALGLDYSLTHSCYDPLPDGRPCGHCDSCQLRAAGFSEAGVADPLVVR